MHGELVGLPLFVVVVISLHCIIGADSRSKRIGPPQIGVRSLFFLLSIHRRSPLRTAAAPLHDDDATLQARTHNTKGTRQETEDGYD
jgi:hypothetical protein